MGRGGRHRPWLFSPCGLWAAVHTQSLGRGGGGELPGQEGTPGLPGPPHPLCSGWAGAGGWCRGRQPGVTLPLGDKVWGTVGGPGSRPCDPSKRSPLGTHFPALKGGPSPTPSASCGPVPSCRQGQVRTLGWTTRSGRPTPLPPSQALQATERVGTQACWESSAYGCCFPSPPLKPALGGCTSAPRHPWLRVPLVQGDLVTIPFSGHTLLPHRQGSPGLSLFTRRATTEDSCICVCRAVHGPRELTSSWSREQRPLGLAADTRGAPHGDAAAQRSRKAGVGRGAPGAPHPLAGAQGADFWIRSLTPAFRV